MFPQDTHILIVDDQEVARTMISSLLKELGYSNIYENDDGQKAFDFLTACALAEKPIELVICDIHMPEMTGIQLLKNVRQHKDLKKTPFIVATTDNEQSKILTCISLGANDYIVKPINMQLLQKKLGTIWTAIS